MMQPRTMRSLNSWSIGFEESSFAEMACNSSSLKSVLRICRWMPVRSCNCNSDRAVPDEPTQTDLMVRRPRWAMSGGTGLSFIRVVLAK
jgi:hypothetical protein